MMRVFGIAPYPGLRDLLQEIAAEDRDIQLDVQTADLEEAIPLAKRAEKEGYDVIISRGGTASVVRKNVSLPVVDISVSGYDMLRVLTLIKDSNSQVAVIGFPNICQGAATVSSLLDFELPIYSVSHQSEVRAALQNAVQQGAQLILGDVVTVQTAEQTGYHGILITSGRESVSDALAKAKQVCDLHRRGEQRARYFENLLEHDPRGIAAADAEAIIRYVNPVAAGLLGEERERLLGQPLTAIDDSFAEAMQTEGELFLPKKALHAVVAPYPDNEKTGFLLYLQPAAKANSRKQTAVKKLERIATFSQAIGSSKALQDAIAQAKTFANADQNVWISGPYGSGRSLFAQAIHAASKRQARGFYLLACKTADPLEAEAELFGTDGNAGLLADLTGTLYLEDAGHLPPSVQERLLQALREGIPARIIASSTKPWAQLIERGDFNQDAAYRIGELHVKLPPLRDRLDDLQEIARVQIAVHNSQYGKHIVGLRSDVLDRLRAYNWPGNARELELVLGELLQRTHGHYVELEQLEQVWSRYQLQESAPEPAAPEIDLTGTWEQIEQRILLRVLREEGMNQTKAAARLGLNRTTLWRKLHDVLQNETNERL